MMMPTKFALHYCKSDAVIVDIIYDKILVGLLNRICFPLQVDHGKRRERGYLGVSDATRAPVGSIVSHDAFDSLRAVQTQSNAVRNTQRMLDPIGKVNLPMLARILDQIPPSKIFFDKYLSAESGIIVTTRFPGPRRFAIWTAP
jgi:hypothetical protein